MNKGLARDADDLLGRSITAVAHAELSHLCSAMSLHPVDSRFPRYGRCLAARRLHLNQHLFSVYFSRV